MHKRRASRRKKALIAAITAALSGGLLFGFGALAQADTVSGTVIAGQGNHRTINHRAKPSLSAQVNGSSKVGEKIRMSCRTTGDTVENNPRWIFTGAYYIADAFIYENTTPCPSAVRPRTRSPPPPPLLRPPRRSRSTCRSKSGPSGAGTLPA